MIERPKDLILLPNPSAELLADQEARPQHFDHHLLLHGEVEGAVDFRAVASADVTVDAETLVKNGVENVGIDAERFEGARVGAAGGHRWGSPVALAARFSTAVNAFRLKCNMRKGGRVR